MQFTGWDPKRSLRILRDNSQRFSFSILGIIEETHRFRELPDMQYASITDPLMQHINATLLQTQFSKIKKFSLSPAMNNAANAGGIQPPPAFCQIQIPFNYNYQQNPLAKISLDEEGRPLPVDTNRDYYVYTPQIPVDSPAIPDGPPETLTPVSQLRDSLRDTIQSLHELMKTRPILTKRYALNVLHYISIDDVRRSFVYCGYTFNGGPWKDTLIRYGVDPRADPQYRQYQSITFQIELYLNHSGRRPWVDQRTVINSTFAKTERDKKSHTFDGQHFVPDGKTWQVCDITDRQLKQVLENAPHRQQCDLRTSSGGWFYNGTWAKARTIMKDKLDIIRSGKKADESLYEPLLDFPDIYDVRKGVDRNWYGVDNIVEEYGRKPIELLSAIKTQARNMSNIQKKAKRTKENRNVSGSENESEWDWDDEEARWRGLIGNKDIVEARRLIAAGELEDQDNESLDSWFGERSAEDGYDRSGNGSGRSGDDGEGVGVDAR
jgi:general transcription factor 3C polypeptide 5 (transcription factor C subunit 1)